MRAPLAALLAALLGGCSGARSFDLTARETDTGIPADGDDGGDATPLRIDVHPPDATGYTAQSHLVPAWGDWSDLTIELSPTVLVSGIVTGFDANPTSPGAELPDTFDTGGTGDTGDTGDTGGAGDTGVPAPPDVTVPGEDQVPVFAQVRAILPGTITEEAVDTDENGWYELRIPAASGYVLATIPIDPPDLPARVRTDIDLSSSERRDVSLDYANAVIGTLSWSGDVQLPSSTAARLVDPATGVAGASVDVDPDGRFELRAEPGTWTLQVSANDTSWLPTLEQEIVVEADTVTTVHLDFGTLDPVGLGGHVVDATGRAVEDATVRLTSTALDAAHGTSTITIDTDVYGQFSRMVLPGEWTVEVIPPYDSSGRRSPTATSLHVTTDVDLGDVELPDRIPFDGVVRDANGVPMPGVVVTAREQGFDGYQYSTTTADDGSFALEVPDVPLLVTLDPPDDTAAITHYEVEVPSAGGPEGGFRVARGTPVGGTVLAGGEPVAFAIVELRTEEGDLYGQTITGADGTFSVRIEEPASR